MALDWSGTVVGLNGPRYMVISRASGSNEVVAALGNLEGLYGISSSVFGVGIGDYSSGNYLRWEPAGGFYLAAGGGVVSLAEEGLTLAASTVLEDQRKIRWKDGESTIASIGAYTGTSGGEADFLIQVRGGGTQAYALIEADGENEALSGNVTIQAMGGTSDNSVVLKAGASTPGITLYSSNAIGSTGTIQINGNEHISLSATEIRLSGLTRLSTPIGCRVYRKSDQTIPSGAWTALQPNVEVYDNGGTWSSGNPTRFTAPEDGYYCIEAQALFTDSSSAGVRQIGIRDQDGNMLKVCSYPPLGDIAYGFTPMSVVLGNWYMASGQWLEVVVFQDSGSSMPIRRRDSTSNQLGNGIKFWRAT